MDRKSINHNQKVVLFGKVIGSKTPLMIHPEIEQLKGLNNKQSKNKTNI